MEVIDPENKRNEVERLDSFRPDLIDYEGSGFDRGHLVASADRRATGIKNSETFLLSNMSPQRPNFNRGIWKKLEQEVRNLAKKFVEVYVICGPLFDIEKPIKVIGQDDKNKIVIPIPHAYFKSVLAENIKGKLSLWSFILPNEATPKSLSDFLCLTTEIERRAGISLWDRLRGESADNMKRKKRKMWKISS